MINILCLRTLLAPPIHQPLALPSFKFGKCITKAGESSYALVINHWQTRSLGHLVINYWHYPQSSDQFFLLEKWVFPKTVRVLMEWKICIWQWLWKKSIWWKFYETLEVFYLSDIQRSSYNFVTTVHIANSNMQGTNIFVQIKECSN